MVNALFASALNNLNQTLSQTTESARKIGQGIKEEVEESAVFVGNAAQEQLSLTAKYVADKTKRAFVDTTYLGTTAQTNSFAKLPQASVSQTKPSISEDKDFFLEPVSKLKKLIELLHISPSAKATSEEVYRLCEETVLDRCKKQDWETIEKIRHELKHLDIKFGHSLFEKLILERQVEAVSKAIQLNLADVLAFGDFKICALHTAFLFEDLAIIDLLLKHIDINQKNEDGLTPLQIAVLLRKEKSINFLLKKGVIPEEKCSLIGNLLHLSLYSHNLLIAAFHLYKDHGFLEGLDKVQQEKLLEHVKRGNPDLLEDLFFSKLEQRGLSDLKSRYSLLSLHIFKSFDEALDSILFCKSPTDVLQHLLYNCHQKTHFLVNAVNAEGQAPLHIAAAMGNLDAMQLLYMKGANVNCKDHQGRTPMHIAAELGQLSSIYRLYYYGAKIHVYDKDHCTPLTLAKGATKEALLDIAERKGELKTTPPNFNITPIENAVLKGGGAKGPGYIGIWKFLEETGSSADIRNCLGTSAGAITATFLACGYSSAELKKHMIATSFPDLLNSDLLATLLKELTSPAHPLLKPLKVLRGVLKSFIKTTFRTAKKAVTAPHKLAIDFAKEVYGVVNFTGMLSGDKIREWIDTLIEEKTGIKHCTFKELVEGIEAGKPFKHLYVVSTKASGSPEITCFNSKDKRWANLVISDAVFASMTIPGIFRPHTLHFKNEQGKRYKDESFGKFFDGGMFANYLPAYFDRDVHAKEGEFKRPAFNPHTLGFNLFSPEENHKIGNPNNPYTFLKNIISLYFHSQELIANMYPEDQYRTVNVDHLGTNTVAFHIKGKELENLIQSGWDSFKKFSEAEPKKLTPVFCRKNAHLIHLKPHLPNFLQRAELLSQLRKELLPNKDQKNVVIKNLVGAEGSGKTELACFFATRYVYKYSIIWTIDCSSETTINESYSLLAKALNLDETGDDEKRIRSKVFERLAHSRYKNPWLLIFDNVSSTIVCPTAEKGMILLISRKGELLKSDSGKYIFPSEINVPFYTHKEALLFLEKFLAHEDLSKRVLLAEELKLSPKALDRAVKYMELHKISIEEYLKVLKT